MTTIDNVILEHNANILRFEIRQLAARAYYCSSNCAVVGIGIGVGGIIIQSYEQPGAIISADSCIRHGILYRLYSSDVSGRTSFVFKLPAVGTANKRNSHFDNARPNCAENSSAIMTRKSPSSADLQITAPSAAGKLLAPSRKAETRVQYAASRRTLANFGKYLARLRDDEQYLNAVMP